MKKADVRMEDINNFTGIFLDSLRDKIDDYDKLTSLVNEDELFDSVRNALEKFFNYPNYKNYN